MLNQEQPRRAASSIRELRGVGTQESGVAGVQELQSRRFEMNSCGGLGGTLVSVMGEICIICD
jgi:hypothetical protein